MKLLVRLYSDRGTEQVNLRIQHIPQGTSAIEIEAKSSGDEVLGLNLSFAADTSLIGGEDQRNRRVDDPAIGDVVDDPDRGGSIISAGDQYGRNGLRFIAHGGSFQPRWPQGYQGQNFSKVTSAAWRVPADPKEAA